jgi:predicted acyl esterase
MTRDTGQVRDGMRIDWDVPIRMKDGTELRADVYRPIADGRHPVIMTYGPYAKWLHFPDMRTMQWERLIAVHPEVMANSSGRYQAWEVVDPERWVPDGYACVRVDSRGAGRSPGLMDNWSLQEAEDFAACIDWAGVQPWSNGKVGLNGISYYAMNQWQVAALKPKHLAAICAWEGSADLYRDMSYHGGIPSTFAREWINTVLPVQHGKGTRGYRSKITGDWVAGPVTLSEEELANNRREIGKEAKKHPLANAEFWRKRDPDWSKIDVPLLSAANWGGHGLHTRGNFEGYLQAAGKDKWLEVHGSTHWFDFYNDYGVALQKKFFGHFLKGEDTGWSKQPPVALRVRHPGERFVERAEQEWPLKRTQWTKYYLDADNLALSAAAPKAAGSATYAAMGDGVTLLSPAMAKPTEITGPIAAKLWVSSATTDADLFLVLRAFSPEMKEVLFHGALEPHCPLAFGWLRVSHRKLDPKRSLPYRPFHPHDDVQPLEPGRVYEVDVEILPTSIVLPKGFRLGLSIRGKDYQYTGDLLPGVGGPRVPFTGVGPFRHNDGEQRPLSVYGGNVTIHTGADHPAHLLLPVIP